MEEMMVISMAMSSVRWLETERVKTRASKMVLSKERWKALVMELALEEAMGSKKVQQMEG